MTLAQILYLTEVVSNVGCVIGFIVLIFGISTVILSFIWGLTTSMDGYSEDSILTVILKKIFSKSWVIGLCLLVGTAIPSKETMYLMLGATYLQQSNLPTKVSEVLDLKLDDVIKQLKEKK